MYADLTEDNEINAYTSPTHCVALLAHYTTAYVQNG